MSNDWEFTPEERPRGWPQPNAVDFNAQLLPTHLEGPVGPEGHPGHPGPRGACGPHCEDPGNCDAQCGTRWLDSQSGGITREGLHDAMQVMRAQGATDRAAIHKPGRTQ